MTDDIIKPIRSGKQANVNEGNIDGEPVKEPRVLMAREVVATFEDLLLYVA